MLYIGSPQAFFLLSCHLFNMPQAFFTSWEKYFLKKKKNLQQSMFALWCHKEDGVLKLLTFPYSLTKRATPLGEISAHCLAKSDQSCRMYSKVWFGAPHLQMTGSVKLIWWRFALSFQCPKTEHSGLCPSVKFINVFMLWSVIFIFFSPVWFHRLF